MLETRDNWHYTQDGLNPNPSAKNPANSTLPFDAVAVQYIMAKARHITTSDLDHQLSQRHDELMAELVRRALEQNPDLANELKEVESGQERVKEIQRRDMVDAYREWQKKQFEERKANRHIRYDDSRNINALLGLRRSSEYKIATRQGKIELELERYYYKYNQEPPPEMLKELAKLRRAKELYLKRVKRDADGRIIRPRMAG